MKNIQNYIPGYRTKKRWKMIIASIYYAFSLLAFTSGIGGFLFFAAVPFVIFSFIDAIRYKKPKHLLITLVSFVLMVIGAAMLPDPEPQIESEPSPTISATAIPSASPSVSPTTSPTASPTPEPSSAPVPLPTPAPTPISTPVPVLPTISQPIAPEPHVDAAPASDLNTSANSSSVSSYSDSSVSSSTDTEMVWVGETGTKYHYKDCRSLKGKGRQITMEEALAEGRTSCGICHR